MNEATLKKLLGSIKAPAKGRFTTVTLATKSKSYYTFIVSGSERQFSFDEELPGIVRLETETGIKWVECSEIEAVEI